MIWLISKSFQQSKTHKVMQLPKTLNWALITLALRPVPLILSKAKSLKMRGTEKASHDKILKIKKFLLEIALDTLSTLI